MIGRNWSELEGMLADRRERNGVSECDRPCGGRFYPVPTPCGSFDAVRQLQRRGASPGSKGGLPQH